MKGSETGFLSSERASGGGTAAGSSPVALAASLACRQVTKLEESLGTARDMVTVAPFHDVGGEGPLWDAAQLWSLWSSSFSVLIFLRNQTSLANVYFLPSS